VIIGLKLYRAEAPAANASLTHEVIGPMINNVKGTTINNVKNGTKNVLTTVGTIFLKYLSTLEANHTATIIGITDEV